MYSRPQAWRPGRTGTMGIATQLLTEPWVVVGALAAQLQHPGNLVMLVCIVVLGVFQLVAHTYHPAQVALFGGKPKVVMTADHLAPEFAELRQIFLKHLTSGQDLAAQYVVYWKGQKVVDICAGQKMLRSIGVEEPKGAAAAAAAEQEGPDAPPPPPPPPADGEEHYGPNHVQLCWSAKEVLAPLAIALAEDRGWLKYDEPVASYWPEFGAAGKADITVAQLMRHDGGLWALEPPLTAAEFAAPSIFTARVAAAKPRHPREFGGGGGAAGSSARCHHEYT
eukprot:SAG22_NODE_5102_length_1085_cov_2.295132_1_plen_279_part_01